MNFLFLRNRVFWLHVSFWMLYFIYRYIDISPFLGAEQSVLVILIPGTLNIIFSYGHYAWLVPFLSPKKQYVRYAIGTLLFLSVMIVCRSFIEYQVLFKVYDREYYQVVNGLRLMSTSWDLLSFATVIALINFTIDRFILERQRKALENEKLTAELNYLKAQINPHFLFNTLHNLNYLAQAKSDQATEVIIKLSNIMRYMIYESNKPQVPLLKEIDYVKDYLDLERIRLNNQFSVDFDASKVNSQTEIAPLILIPFVENAFKHGVKDKYPDSWVKIDLSSDNNYVKINVRNSVHKEDDHPSEHSGFGLENVKRRLELSYPGKYDLLINHKEDEFIIELDLDVS